MKSIICFVVLIMGFGFGCGGTPKPVIEPVGDLTKIAFTDQGRLPIDWNWVIGASGETNTIELSEILAIRSTDGTPLAVDLECPSAKKELSEILKHLYTKKDYSEKLKYFTVRPNTIQTVTFTSNLVNLTTKFGVSAAVAKAELDAARNKKKVSLVIVSTSKSVEPSDEFVTCLESSLANKEGDFYYTSSVLVGALVALSFERTDTSVGVDFEAPKVEIEATVDLSKTRIDFIQYGASDGLTVKDLVEPLKVNPDPLVTLKVFNKKITELNAVASKLQRLRGK